MNEPGLAARAAGAQEASFIKKIFDALPDAVGYWDADLLCRFANMAFFDWFGKTPESVLGTHYRELVNEQFYRANEPYIRAALAGLPQRYERTVPKSDGRLRNLLVNYIPDIDERGTVAGFFVNVNDVTHLKETEAQLDVAAAVFGHAADGIMVTDPSGTILSVNPAFTEITGYAAHEAVDRSSELLESGRHGPEFFAALRCELAAHGRWQGEMWSRHKSGEIFVERRTITTVRDSAGEAVRFVSIFSDITDAWRKHERLRHLAFHDELTGLPTRAVFADRLADEIAVAERSARSVAVLFIDLDGFKAVNDRLGHAAGDAVLRAVAGKLQALMRRTDLVARVGGDEFAAFALDPRSETPLARIAANMIAAVNEPVHVQGCTARVGASIGIALYPAHGQSAADVIREADAAMYTAKNAGKNTYRFARPAQT